MSGQVKITGQLFEARSSRFQPCELVHQDSKLKAMTSEGIIADELSVDSVQAGRDIFFSCGKYFRADDLLPDDLLRGIQGKPRRFISWIEAFSPLKAIVLVGLLGTFAILLRAAAASIGIMVAALFPTEWEQAIGWATYQEIGRVMLSPSQIPGQKQQRLRQAAVEMAERADLETDSEIQFHSSNWLGPNAIAFAGGPIVVTDDLVELLDEEEILAVLAHEYAHLEERHSLKQLAELAGLLAIGTVFLSADETIVDALTIFAINSWGMTMSREFERQADLGALDILAASQRNPEALVKALEHLHSHRCAAAMEGETDCIEDYETHWLSTHPSWPERREYISERIGTGF